MKIKKLINNFLSLMLLPLVWWMAPINSEAATNYQNPSSYEINKLLTEIALENDVPPEIVKAIAYEESAWTQFKSGQPYVSVDGGIGIMQVTNTEGFDENKLKFDIDYNIQAGIDILNQKWQEGVKGTLPTIGDNSRDVLEHWYFAVLAYNGKKEVNSPIIKSDGSGDRNYNSYQDQVYTRLTTSNLMSEVGQKNIVNIRFQLEDFTYTGEPEHNLLFNKMHYELVGSGHSTKHKFHQGDLVISATGQNFRELPTTSSTKVGDLSSGTTEVLQILDPFTYDITYKNDTNPNNWIDEIANHFVWYNIQRDNGTDAFVASGPLQYIGKRISGSSRYFTAIDISKEGWPTGADTVVLARGDAYPDALAGAPLAYKLDAPLLLTAADYLTPETRTEIERLGAKHVVILGSEGAISNQVKITLESEMGISVDRIGGHDRYETAQLIAEELNPNPTKAVIAYGLNFPDALSVAPYAAKNGIPILLTRTDNVPKETLGALQGVKETYVVGGPGIINEDVVNYKLPNATRVNGHDRYDTSAAIANQLQLTNENNKVFIATGMNFADALAGSVLAAKHNAPLLLTRPDDLPDSIEKTIVNHGLKEYFLLGGSGVVSVEQQLGRIYLNN